MEAKKIVEQIKELELFTSDTQSFWFENGPQFAIWQRLLYYPKMSWQVGFSNKKTAKKVQELPENIRDSLQTLMLEIKVAGPVRGNWPNYSKLGKDEHHCHLSRRYVACWRDIESKIQIVEVYYAGSREKAPY